MSPTFSPLYQDLKFLSPLSDGRAAELGRFVGDHAAGTVVDVGCGWAELLIQILEQHPALQGLGLDHDGESIEHAGDLATNRGVRDRLELVAGDAKQTLPDDAGAVLCIGASQTWGPPVEAHLPLDYSSALRALRSLLQPGLPAVFGDHIWTTEPTPQAIEPLAGRRDEFVLLPDLLDIARQSGFLVMRTHQASLDEWDQFESGFTAGYVRWLLENPNDHPDAEEVHRRLTAQSDAYFRGYRGTLGMAYLELLAV